MIDQDMKELADALKGIKEPTNLSIGWASVITLISLLMGSLFGGWVTNRMDIIELKTQFKSVIAWQEKMDPVITAIRYDQINRKQGGED